MKKMIIALSVIFIFIIQCSKQGDSAVTPPAADAGKVASPTYTPVSNTEFVGSVTVQIECATSGAIIRYTTDGTTPTESRGTIYSSAFILTGNTTVKAVLQYATQQTEVTPHLQAVLCIQARFM
jgi:hypothetical protein